MISRLRGLAARLKIDGYILAIVGMVVLASLLPARGEAAHVVGLATKVGIAMVFFLHGSKLSREAVIAGLTHWRLHGLVLLTTFVLWPIVGLGTAALPGWIMPAALAPGVVYLACLPSTIQSQIGMTAIARGNVAAAVCGASVSNLLGMVLTPLAAGMLLHAQGSGLSAASFQAILLQLLAPFIAGQVLQPWIGAWVRARSGPLGYVDKGSILLVVYNAFSGAVVARIWTQVSGLDLARIEAGVRPGTPVRRGEVIATMGRSAGGYAIPKDRAHLHFEIGFVATQNFPAWYAWRKFGSPNEHGMFNGMNLMGIDPHDFLRELPQVAILRVADHRNHQATIGLGRHAEVDRAEGAGQPWQRLHAPGVRQRD